MSDTPFLSVRSLRKSYARNVVLHDVDLDFRPGRVYGLLGENGAGKSTLAKIVSGLIEADSGTVEVEGQARHFKAPKDALAQGISIITQEQTLALDRSAAENVFSGNLPQRAGFVKEKELRGEFARVAGKLGFSDIAAATVVKTLSIAKRQQVEIMRALARGSRLIIMDEPTAILSTVETQQLLQLIRRLADEGLVILLISHFLEDVLSVADDVVVLRDGAVTYFGPATGQTPRSLTEHMVGRVIDFEHQRPAPLSEHAPVRLRVEGLRRADGIGPVSLTIRAGEIVGMAGLIGSGRTEVARAIFGADPKVAGTVTVDDVEIAHASPRVSVRHGLGMVCENRKEQGLSLIHSIRDNDSIVVRDRFARFGFRTVRAEKAAVRAVVERTDVKCRSMEQPIWQLSGGNQQKVLFAKWMMAEPKVLIVDEPTRGVDVGAKAQIYDIIADLAAQGVAILIISSEIEEVMGLSHRLLVMRRGQLVREFAWGEASRAEVIAAAFGDYDNDGGSNG
ncbi:MAG: sugar ABC transporter ATP-binding protein [Propionibacteriaceae bacterium]|jgi:ribose transport system ATP-binding protein|nr:sugar ABC transporter ATP-binding protein [Propionibacteriaceae bacterium]